MFIVWGPLVLVVGTALVVVLTQSNKQYDKSRESVPFKNSVFRRYYPGWVIGIFFLTATAIFVLTMLTVPAAYTIEECKSSSGCFIKEKTTLYTCRSVDWTEIPFRAETCDLQETKTERIEP